MRVLVDIQDEPVELDKVIPEIAACKELRHTLKQALEMLNARACISEKDAALLECVHKQMDDLLIPLLRKIVFFGITSLYSNFSSIRSRMQYTGKTILKGRL